MKLSRLQRAPGARPVSSANLRASVSRPSTSVYSRQSSVCSPSPGLPLAFGRRLYSTSDLLKLAKERASDIQHSRQSRMSALLSLSQASARRTHRHRGQGSQSLFHRCHRYCEGSTFETRALSLWIGLPSHQPRELGSIVPPPAPIGTQSGASSTVTSTANASWSTETPNAVYATFTPKPASAPIATTAAPAVTTNASAPISVVNASPPSANATVTSAKREGRYGAAANPAHPQALSCPELEESVEEDYPHLDDFQNHFDDFEPCHAPATDVVNALLKHLETSPVAPALQESAVRVLGKLAKGTPSILTSAQRAKQYAVQLTDVEESPLGIGVNSNIVGVYDSLAKAEMDRKLLSLGGLRYALKKADLPRICEQLDEDAWDCIAELYYNKELKQEAEAKECRAKLMEDIEFKFAQGHLDKTLDTLHNRLYSPVETTMLHALKEYSITEL